MGFGGVDAQKGAFGGYLYHFHPAPIGAEEFFPYTSLADWGGWDPPGSFDLLNRTRGEGGVWDFPTALPRPPRLCLRIYSDVKGNSLFCPIHPLYFLLNLLLLGWVWASLIRFFF